LDSNANNIGWGQYTNLKPITTSTKVPKPTRTIKINEPLFRRFVVHSKKFYNVESFDTIIENLLNSYEETPKTHTGITILVK
jgi:hypothetical protein